MSQLFSAPKIPAPVANPAAPAAPPKRSDPAVEEARRTALAQAKRARGRRSTIITGGLGDTSNAPVARATLLGG